MSWYFQIAIFNELFGKDFWDAPCVNVDLVAVDIGSFDCMPAEGLLYPEVLELANKCIKRSLYVNKDR